MFIRGTSVAFLLLHQVIVNQERLLAMSSEAAIGSKTAVRTTAVLGKWLRMAGNGCH